MDNAEYFGVIPTTASLGQLIHLYGDKGLRIPPYQRGYEWDARNIQRFVDTLWDEFEKSKGMENPVFLGSIQVSEEKNQPSKRSIIDGRQRITTLALLEAYLLRSNKAFKDKMVSSLLCGQDDPELVSTIQFVKENDIEPFGTLREKNPSILRLNKKGKKDADDCNSIYKRNVRYIATIFKGKTEHVEDFLNYLRKDVFFIVITVTKRDLTSIIKIFDSMNSTGQPLSDEAMFKLRLYAHVRSTEPTIDADTVMQHINGTYKLVEDYNSTHKIPINMSDLLWGFRLFCVANKHKIIFDSESYNEIKADTFLMPTLQFFEMLFSLAGVKVSLEFFREYAEAHIRFYDEAYFDTSWKEEGEKAFYYSLPDLFEYTRYSSFWALPIVCFAFRDGTVLEALKACSPVFQACLAWSVCYDKANKKFRTQFLYSALESLDQDDKLIKAASEKINENDKSRQFWDRVEKDIYEAYRQAYLLLAIIGIQDEMRSGKSFGEALELYFMSFGENRPQLEHIYAKSKWNEIGDASLISRLNGLGNLVPLEARINKGDNKAEYPSIKFASEKFFDKSKNIESVKVLISVYHSALADSLDLDKPDIWAEKIVKNRFIAAKNRLIELMSLLKFSS